jgi:alpha-glucuronidase
MLGVLATGTMARAEDGYELWLRYPLVTNAARLAQYRSALTGLHAAGDSATPWRRATAS